MSNFYGRKKHIEDRPMGICENPKCNIRNKQRLNTFQYKNGITANICDKCTQRFSKGSI